MNIILDACSVIAYERGEDGANLVERFLVEEDPCWIHAINLCEVYYDFLRAGGQAAAEQVLADLRGFGVQIYDQMDADLWKRAASHKANLRRISLADCFALALTQKLEGQLLTSDMTEFGPVAAQGLCEIQFIR